MDRTQQNSPIRPGQPPGLLARAIAFALSAALVALAFMFSLVALAVVAIGGLLLGGWLWWKTRALRRQMRDARPVRNAQPARDPIIEGAFVREAGSDLRLR